MVDRWTGEKLPALVRILVALLVLWLVSCQSSSHFLEGRVVDAHDGSALAAQVIVGEESIDTESDGTFSVSLDPGLHQVQVLAPGHVAQSFTVAIDQADSSHEQEVSLHRRLLRGVLRDSDTGQAIAGASVALVALGPASATTDQEGRFEIDSSSQMSLSVSCSGYLPTKVRQAEVEAAFDSTGVLRADLDISLAPRVLTGTVLDAGTARPISGTLVSIGRLRTYSNANGHYEMRYVEPGMEISFSSQVHRPLAEVAYTGQTTQDAVLDPWKVILTILDGATGDPLPEARVSAPRVSGLTDVQGRAALSLLPGTPMTITLQDYQTATLAYQGEETLDLSLQPFLTADLRDASSGEPIPNALVQVFSARPEPTLLRTDAQGRVELGDASKALTLTIKAPGYRRISVPITQTRKMRFDLEPFEVRGVRAPFGLLAAPDRMEALLSLVESSELNAIVLDVKSDGAQLAWPSPLPLAQEAGAYQKGLMDLQQLLDDCHRRGIYVVARIVVFKDHLLAQAHPEWALKWPDGRLYQDGEGLHWMDPFLQEPRDYNIALALEVAAMGFDEIQFDYIRFPSSGRVGRLVYSQEWEWDLRTAAITEFARQAYEALSATPAFVSLDIFGLNVWLYAREENGDHGDNGIGQNIETLAPYMDYISPMLYPGLFAPGELGYKEPALSPYEIIYHSVVKTQERIPTKVRPWLQYYSRRVTYGPVDYLKQKKAAQDTQTCGWLFWHPAGRYQAEIFDSKAFEKYPEAAVSLPKEE